MEYLLSGLIITLVLTTFMVAFMTSAVVAELREWVARGRTGRRD